MVSTELIIVLLHWELLHLKLYPVLVIHSVMMGDIEFSVIRFLKPNLSQLLYAQPTIV